jgi:hypothetical protein
MGIVTLFAIATLVLFAAGNPRLAFACLLFMSIALVRAKRRR